jgi:saccharopepsin
VYITNISVGTPPQHFNVLLSISTSDILLPSTHCGFTCHYRYPQYDSKRSSTYVANGTVITRDYPRFSANAIVSQDTFHIAGIEIKNVSFAEATNIHRRGDGRAIGLGDDQWDGILGIAPHGGNADAMPNFDAPLDDPFLSVISQGLLDRNIFGLKFSNGTDHPGEIMFGGVNHDLYEGELKTLPLLNDTDDFRQIPGRWNVAATKITIGPGWVSLKDYVASLDSDTPFIGLPGLFVALLCNYLGMEQKGKQGPYPIPYSIDCSRRDELDNFTLTLGDHDFVITPYQYTIEMDVEEWGGHRCISAFWPLNANEKFIIVGSSFLRAFYGVFDLDERTVSCESSHFSYQGV